MPTALPRVLFDTWLILVDSVVESLVEPFESEMASEGRYDSLLTAIVEDWLRALEGDEAKFGDIREMTMRRLDRYEAGQRRGDQAVAAELDSLWRTFASLAEIDEPTASEWLGEEIAASFAGTKNNLDLLRGYYRATFMVAIAYSSPEPFGRVQLNAVHTFFEGLREHVYPLRFTRYPDIEGVLLAKPGTRASERHQQAVAFYSKRIRELDHMNGWLFQQTLVGEHLAFFAILDNAADAELGDWVMRGVYVSIEGIIELGIKRLVEVFVDEHTLLVGVIRYCRLVLQRPIYGRGALGGSLAAVDDTLGTSLLAFVPEDFHEEAESIFLRASMNGLVGSFASVYVVLVAVITSPHRPFAKERCLAEAHAAMRARLETRGGAWDDTGQQVIRFLLEKELEWLPRWGLGDTSLPRLQDEVRRLLADHFHDCAPLSAPTVLAAERALARRLGLDDG